MNPTTLEHYTRAYVLMEYIIATIIAYRKENNPQLLEDMKQVLTKQLGPPQAEAITELVKQNYNKPIVSLIPRLEELLGIKS